MNADWTPPPHCIGVVGWKNSGKTTLVSRLVSALTDRGYRLATVKHAHHSFTIDTGNTDSAKHRQAGAAQVGIVSNGRWALISETGKSSGDTTRELAAMIARLEPCDVIVIEGFKGAPHRKIEARRAASNDDQQLTEIDPNIVAVASDAPSQETGLPSFDLDDIDGLTAFVVALLDLPQRNSVRPE